MEIIELPVEHIELAPLNEAEALYWHNLADEVCGLSYNALVAGPADEPQAH
jgi:hypothetical protein